MDCKMIIEAFNCLEEKSTFFIQIDKNYYPCTYYTELNSCISNEYETNSLTGSTGVVQQNDEYNEKFNDTLSFFQLIFVISTLFGLLLIVFLVFILKKCERRPDLRYEEKDSYLVAKFFRNIILLTIYIYIITNIFILIFFAYDFSYIKKLHCFFNGHKC